MINIDPRERHYFEVRIGHNLVMVEGFSREEAIRHAREKLSADLPRLWDVIQKMDSNRFVVSRLPRKAADRPAA